MDAQHVETLAKAVAGVGSRRRALGGFLAGALALASQQVTARPSTRAFQSSFPPVEPGMYEEPYRAPGQCASLVPPPPAERIPAPSWWARTTARIQQAHEDVREAVADRGPSRPPPAGCRRSRRICTGRLVARCGPAGCLVARRGHARCRGQESLCGQDGPGGRFGHLQRRCPERKRKRCRLRRTDLPTLYDWTDVRRSSRLQHRPLHQHCLPCLSDGRRVRPGQQRSLSVPGGGLHHAHQHRLSRHVRRLPALLDLCRCVPRR